MQFLDKHGQTMANHFLARKHSVVGISWDINGCDQSPYEDIEYNPFMFEFASVTCINILNEHLHSSPINILVRNTASVV